jgi:hypothetical protein
MILNGKILLVGEERVGASEAELLPKLRLLLVGLTQRKRGNLRKNLPYIEFAESGCWNWMRYKDRYGYGALGVNGKYLKAHRFIYENTKGPIKDNLPLDHLCRNHACVNPNHLEPVTQRINLLRGNSIQAQNARKTHCKNGHEFSKENTYRLTKGGRVCRTCSLAKYHNRKKQHSIT